LGGDDFYESLPVFFNEIKGSRPLVIIFTDGQPGALELLQTIISNARKQKIIVFGVGLNITSFSDKKGMEFLFGENHYLLCEVKKGNGADFAKKMADELRRLVRLRLR
ncbi:MAG TPA: VWA domain-containing protein, partial [Pyrinomonadaceae bacterium]|nr:VWA domain-containing protein [Pyrinomonadaceae bacterium]